MKKWLLAMLLLVPMAAHATCSCDDDQEDDDGTFHPYTYLGGKVGTSHFADQMLLPASQSSTGYGAFLGARYSEYFGVEGEYTYLGKFTTAQGDGHATAYSLDAIHEISLGGVTMLVKLGLANATVAAFGARRSHLDLTYGAGLELELSRDLMARVSYDRYKVDSFGTVSTVGFGNLGLAYIFR